MIGGSQSACLRHRSLIHTDNPLTGEYLVCRACNHKLAEIVNLDFPDKNVTLNPPSRQLMALGLDGVDKYIAVEILIAVINTMFPLLRLVILSHKARTTASRAGECIFILAWLSSVTFSWYDVATAYDERHIREHSDSEVEVIFKSINVTRMKVYATVLAFGVVLGLI